ncbi:ATP-dependent DNA ligase [Rathayibacter iranicus]|uniref:ATP-dependent DNA ligase n=2 Tax=Rathayibacter iranicus TaxID=59737 RepID=A0AAD1EMS6_9MICO|nr:ATP-dependent DNA ligase [Rathayibacter iranicus]AZZ56472.1 ATP-dependent DNA ligase [Rathayibacter iranicus]MWV31855.1 ATP-dependent DNA ligase [Rathayibacter iranicus NCPPB 2253 = VKM Ac-1602]PPI44724.1 ATP-dependent DNA ligase [Rathayibacter iranicus]PPI59154.1 ATP-dependent DNA ligase [Rathayibacter iranicus]PPI70243.1 ATP-dependent DNA ligase [Rathayibacter iranicus]
MGALLYGTPPTSHEIDDRALAHLQIVMINKFRRDEAFAFQLDASSAHGTGRQTLWLHPSIPLQFSFHGSRMPAINAGWVRALMEEANSGRGLRLVAEPAQQPDSAGLTHAA